MNPQALTLQKSEVTQYKLVKKLRHLFQVIRMVSVLCASIREYHAQFQRKLKPFTPQLRQQAMDEQRHVERVAQQRRLQALLKDHNQQVKFGSNIK